MRPLPVADDVLETARQVYGRAERHVIGEPGDPTGDVRPCEYLVTASELYPGRPTFSVLVELDDADREAAAAGRRLWLTLDGAEVPWALTFEPEPNAEPATGPPPLLLPQWAIDRAEAQGIDLDDHARRMGFAGFQAYGQ